jgi:hypothetical protein
MSSTKHSASIVPARFGEKLLLSAEAGAEKIRQKH